MIDFEIEFPDPTSGEKCPAVWRGKSGKIHRAVGAQMILTDRATFLMWTACGKSDIPTGSVWLQNPGDYVSCPECLQAERIFEEDAREEARNNGQFGVGA